MGPLRSIWYTSKPRLLQILLPGLLFFLAAPLGAQNSGQSADSIRAGGSSIGKEEASSSLFSLSRTDSSVNLLLQGSWEAGLTAQGGLALTELGLQAAATNNPFLFTQRADLTLSLWIEERWFIEASFLDDYNLNTYRAGYQGAEDDNLQYVGIGNTGLDFPRFPYLDLGGSSPSSFGVYNRWQFTVSNAGTEEASFRDARLTLHGMVRYDGAKLEEKNYLGNREITQDRLELSEMLRGYSFVLPDENLDTVPTLYIEDPAGDQVDADGSRWRLARPSEYAASARYGIIEIIDATALAAGKRLAVSYIENGFSSLGSYGDTSGTGASGFLGDAQAAFNASSGGKIALRNYPQPGQKDRSLIGTDSNIPAVVTIDSTECLVIWERGSFSPFERLGRYRIQGGAASSVKLVRKADGDESRDYDLEPVLSLGAGGTEPGIGSAESGTGSGSGSGLGSGAALFELVRRDSAYDIRDPGSRWPLVSEMPELYLPASEASSLDMHILVTNYGPSGMFSLGTDVLPGSVQVFRNGLPDPLAVYNGETGEVLLSSPPAEQEHIRIQYLRRSEERRFGSLAAGIGATYTSGGPFSADLAMGLRWNVSPDAFSEASATSPGTVGLSGSLRWDWENLKIQSTAGIAYRQEDTTGMYRALGMEGSQFSDPFPGSGFFQSPVPASLNDSLTPPPQLSSDNQAQLVYRSYTSTDMLGISSLHSIDWEGAQEIPGKTGPYLVGDSTLDTRVLVGEATYTPEHFWAGFQVPLETATTALAEAREILIPFRFYDAPTLGTATVKVYLQIGALDGNAEDNAGSTVTDLTGWENTALVLTVPIFDSATADPVEPLPTQWQNVTITLNDADRRALAGARAMRLVVVTGGTFDSLRTRLLVGPPVVSGTGVRPILIEEERPRPAVTDETMQVDAVETVDTSLRDRYRDIIDTLHPSGSSQRVMKVTFEGMGNGIGAGVDTRIVISSITNYKTLTFFIRGPQKKEASSEPSMGDGNLTLCIAPGLDHFNSPTLRATLPLSAFNSGQWSRVDIQYNRTSPHVLVDGVKVQEALVSFDAVSAMASSQDGTKNTSQYLAVYLAPSDPTSSLPDGTFSMDEILFTEPTASFQGRGGVYVQWEQKGPWLSIKKAPLISDLKLTSSSEGLYQIPVEVPYPAAFGTVQNQSMLTFTVLGLPVEVNGGIAATGSMVRWNGGHRLSLPLGPARLADTFSIDETNFAHGSSGLLDFSQFTGADGNLKLELSGLVTRDTLAVERKWKYALEGRQKRFSAGTTGEVIYKSTEEQAYSNQTSGYSQTWLDSWEPLVPDSGMEAKTRIFSAGVKTGIDPKTLGILTEIKAASQAGYALNKTEQNLLYSLSLPFTIKTINGRITNERETSQQADYYGSDIQSDLYLYRDFTYQSRDLLLLAPGYALFTQTLSELVARSRPAQGTIVSKTTFTDNYSLSLQAPPPASSWGLLVPSQFQMKLYREAQQNYSNYTESLHWDTMVASTALNLFGAYGYKPLFKFYKDDEFSQQLDANLVWRDALLEEWKVGGQQRAVFYGFSDSQLEYNHAINFVQSGWSYNLGLNWIHPAPNSLVGTFFSWFASSNMMKNTIPGLIAIAEGPKELLQKENLESKIDINDSSKIEITIGHESLLRIRRQLNVSVFGKLIYSQDLKVSNFSFIGNAGATLKVQF